jgi:hypothetical protein
MQKSSMSPSTHLYSRLWTDDPVYAHYLTSTFEMLWNQAIDAEERIQQLLKVGPPEA